MSKVNHFFFKDEAFEFMALGALGGSYFRLSDIGECLATISAIKDGDFDSWFDAWRATAERVETYAEKAASDGHKISARDAYLRVANYHNFALFFVLGTKDPTRELACWQAHERALETAASLFEPAGERIEIPYDDATLSGLFFAASDDGKRRPLVILNNGSDGGDIDMMAGVIPALERGYNALVFAGPGQNQSLYEKKIYFRFDWENVITPVVDYAVSRSDIDPDRIVLSGVSQAGYWIPRAVAFEHRIAAAIVDPGVMDVQATWLQHTPKFIMKHYHEGDREKVDSEIAMGEKYSKGAKFQLVKRMEPFGLDSFYDMLKELERWKLKDVVRQITCPMLITDPDDEQFWPGQSQELYDALNCPKTLMRFTEEEGANWHCEPMAVGLKTQRIFDWLDQTLGGPHAG